MKNKKKKMKKVFVVLCENIQQCEFYFNQEKDKTQWKTIKYLELENDEKRKIFITPDNAIYRTAGMIISSISEKGLLYKHPLYTIARRWLNSCIK